MSQRAGRGEVRLSAELEGSRWLLDLAAEIEGGRSRHVIRPMSIDGDCAAT